MEVSNHHSLSEINLFKITKNNHKKQKFLFLQSFKKALFYSVWITKEHLKYDTFLYVCGK